MKKKIGFSLICLIMAIAIFIFVGCAGYSSINVRQPQTDINYVVRGNGTLTVQYGRYVYFVNGTRGTFDDEGARYNRWGDVVQGGIYRARLYGNRIETAANSHNEWEVARRQSYIHDLEANEIEYFDFELVAPSGRERNAAGEVVGDLLTSTQTLEISNRRLENTFRFGQRIEIFEEYEENEDVLERTELHERVDLVDVELIAPKAVGTRGGGGIFIFGNHIYFASPNNLRDRQGNIQYNRTDFYRMRLDGSRVQKIFTTETDADDLPFTFHGVTDGNGNVEAVYLVTAATNEDNPNLIDIVSVRMTDNRIARPYFVTQEATSVYFPVRSEFDRYSNEVGLEDFIFFTRDADRDRDNHFEGNMIVVSTPCGNESFYYMQTGRDITLHQVNDGALFYSLTVEGIDEIRFTNLHTVLLNHSERYAEYASNVIFQESGLVYSWNRPISDFDTMYFFRQHRSNAGFMLAFDSSGVQIISYRNTAFGMDSLFMALSYSPEFLFMQGNYMYYLHNEQVFRTDVFNRNMPSENLSGEMSIVRAGGGQVVSYVAGHVMFFASYDRWTESGTGYSFFSRILSRDDEPFFVGRRAEKDIPTDEQLLNYLRGIEGEYITPEDDDAV